APVPLEVRGPYRAVWMSDRAAVPPSPTQQFLAHAAAAQVAWARNVGVAGPRADQARTSSATGRSTSRSASRTVPVWRRPVSTAVQLPVSGNEVSHQPCSRLAKVIGSRVATVIAPPRSKARQ